MMQQELSQKKREIISNFLKKGFLISSELLDQIKDTDNIGRIEDLLKTGQSGENILMLKQPASRPIQARQAPETPKSQDANIKVVSSYKEDAKKREPQDFVDYFNNRYKSIEKILKQRQELKNTISISKISGKKEKENATIIGIVSDKHTTKNGNLMILVEDPTGQKKVIVNKNKPSLFSEAKDIVMDEVIGVAGVNVGTVMFANNILWPDVPNKEMKKASQEKYALFLSDLHVGSSKFLPDDFERFLKWINGEVGNEQQKHIAKNVECIFIAGDLVDGCGIYPEQDKELLTKDIYQQYEECAALLRKIPGSIPMIICPGNHDAMRISEPQPQLSKEFAKPMYSLNNTTMVSNPAMININSTDNFEGIDVMMYHGYSFDYYVSQVDSLRNQGGYDRADLIMKFLLKRRHLAPSHLSTQYIPDTKRDPLIIEKVPDILISGHIHKTSTANYRNTTLICGSCWQGKTIFQEKVGHNPEPSRVPIINIQTREIKILKFGQ
ncbi:DNA-directed DNA polymerase II small subunit [Candidatus Woesearchaeota archaeon]|nr:DNA-directed DNA polymerase II small subunit [Candidatus Woesearchaeota archaeon]